MGAIRSAIGVLDVVLPGFVTVVAIWMATNVSIFMTAILLALLLGLSTMMTLRTSAY